MNISYNQEKGITIATVGTILMAVTAAKIGLVFFVPYFANP